MPFSPNDEPFFKDGLCLVDDYKSPNFAYVFHIQEKEIDGVKPHIFATYGYVSKFNKAFYQFHKEVEELIFSFGLPIFRIGTKEVFKNHTQLFNVVDGIAVYQYTKRIKWAVK